MKTFFSALALQLRRLLRRGSILACLLLLPLLTLAMGLLLPASSDENILKVGVYIPPSVQTGEKLWQSLQQYSDPQTLFIAANSPEQLQAMVAARSWECGYIFTEDLDARLQRGDYKRIVTRVVSPASLTLYTGWTVSAAILDVSAPLLAEEFLRQSDILPPGQPLPLDAGAFFNTDTVMDVKLEALGRPLDTGGTALMTGAGLARGLMALMLFLLCCLGAVRHSGDMASGFFARMVPYVHRGVLFSASYIALGLLSMASALLCLGLSAVFFPGYLGGLLPEAALLLLYLLYLGCFSYLLSALFKRGQGILALLPFLLIACLLLCPILFDISRWVPPAAPLSMLLPPTLYLRGAAGNTAALWQMPAASACLLLAGLLLNTLRRKPA